jgi:hypothetical protein
MSENLQAYLKLLKSEDANQRRNAIISLGKSGDKQALPPLAHIYKTDPDPALRELALKAGRYIQKQAATPPPPASPHLSFAADVPPSAEIPQWMQNMGAGVVKPKVVTERDRARAATLKDRAIDAQVSNQPDKVVDLLAEALQINPELEKDPMIIGLLAQATGMDGLTALAEIKRLNAEDEAAGVKRKSSTAMDWRETTSFVLEMSIYAVLVAMFAFIPLLIVTLATSLALPINIATSVTSLLVYSLGYGVGTILSSSACSLYLWFVGTTFLGGTGLIFDFLKIMTRALILSVLLITAYYFITGIAFSVSFNTLDVETSLLVLYCVPPLLFTVIISWAIGYAHGFDILTGFFNLVLAYIFAGFLCCGLNFLLSF